MARELSPAHRGAGSPVTSTRCLGLAGTAAVAPFTILYGAGNGLLTIARGTVPLAVFGPVGYGERTLPHSR